MSTFLEFVKQSYGIDERETLPEALLKQLNIKPIRVYERPFAVDPITGLMQPGGFFDVSRGEQLIGIYFTPTLNPPSNIHGYCYVVEAPPSSGIELKQPMRARAHYLWVHRYPPGQPPVQYLFPGRPVLRFLSADFSRSTPGKHSLRFLGYEFPSSGIYSQRRPEWDFEKQIFVIKTTADYLTNSFVAECPEGKLILHLEKVGVYPWTDWKTWMTPPTTAYFGAGKSPLVFPIALTAEIHPAKPFYGKLGPIPFEDPWWKWLLAGLAAICAAMGSVFGKKAYDGGANWKCTQSQGVGSYQKECILEGPEEAVGWGVGAGLFGAAAATLIKLAASDEKDPFRIGEETTEPSRNEATIKETVKLQIDYHKGFPNIAGPCDLGVSWQFERLVDSGKTYTFKKDWSIHGLSCDAKSATSKKSYHLYEPVSVTASFQLGRTQLTGTDAYVLAFLFGPKGQFKPIFLMDVANPGKYEAVTTFTSSDDLGHWDVYLIAQSVDPAMESESPEEAAKYTSGGAILNQVLKLAAKRMCTIELVKNTSFEIRLPIVK